MLVLTIDNLKVDIQQLMDIEENREIANTWAVLNSEPNYRNLASDIILQFTSTYPSVLVLLASLSPDKCRSNVAVIRYYNSSLELNVTFNTRLLLDVAWYG